MLAELLVAKGLLSGRTSVDRTPDLVINWSELSDEGKAFIKADYARWMKSIDRHGTSEAAKAEKQRRWRKFSGER